MTRSSVFTYLLAAVVLQPPVINSGPSVYHVHNNNHNPINWKYPWPKPYDAYANANTKHQDPLIGSLQEITPKTLPADRTPAFSMDGKSFHQDLRPQLPTFNLPPPLPRIRHPMLDVSPQLVRVKPPMKDSVWATPIPTYPHTGPCNNHTSLLSLFGLPIIAGDQMLAHDQVKHQLWGEHHSDVNLLQALLAEFYSSRNEMISNNMSPVPVKKRTTPIEHPYEVTVRPITSNFFEEHSVHAFYTRWPGYPSTAKTSTPNYDMTTIKTPTTTERISQSEYSSSQSNPAYNTFSRPENYSVPFHQEYTNWPQYPSIIKKSNVDAHYLNLTTTHKPDHESNFTIPYNRNNNATTTIKTTTTILRSSTPIPSQEIPSSKVTTQTSSQTTAKYSDDRINLAEFSVRTTTPQVTTLKPVKNSQSLINISSHHVERQPSNLTIVASKSNRINNNNNIGYWLNQHFFKQKKVKKDYMGHRFVGNNIKSTFNNSEISEENDAAVSNVTHMKTNYSSTDEHNPVVYQWLDQVVFPGKNPCRRNNSPLVSTIFRCEKEFYKREFSQGVNELFHDYIRKNQVRQNFDIRIGKRSVNSQKDAVFGEIMDVPEWLIKEPRNKSTKVESIKLPDVDLPDLLLSEYFLEAVETLDEASLVAILGALKEDYLAKSPGNATVVDQVYEKLLTSLLGYKRAQTNWTDRRKRASGRSKPLSGEAAAAALELLTEVNPPHDSEQQDDPKAQEYDSDYEERSSDLVQTGDASFLELLSLASKHNSKPES